MTLDVSQIERTPAQKMELIQNVLSEKEIRTFFAAAPFFDKMSIITLFVQAKQERSLRVTTPDQIEKETEVDKAGIQKDIACLENLLNLPADQQENLKERCSSCMSRIMLNIAKINARMSV